MGSVSEIRGKPIRIFCCSGSGSDFGKVSVAIPDPDKKLVQNLAFSMSEGALFPRKLVSQFIFLDFFYSILCWIRIHIRLRNRIQRKGKKLQFLRVRFHNTADPDPDVTETRPRIRNIIFGFLIVKWLGGACFYEVKLSTSTLGTFFGEIAYHFFYLFPFR
jgi:hypothetical protein